MNKQEAITWVEETLKGRDGYGIDILLVLMEQIIKEYPEEEITKETLWLFSLEVKDIAGSIQYYQQKWVYKGRYSEALFHYYFNVETYNPRGIYTYFETLLGDIDTSYASAFDAEKVCKTLIEVREGARHLNWMTKYIDEEEGEKEEG